MSFTLLINTERKPPTALDSAVYSLLRVRDRDGLYKSCDECGANIEDDAPEFTLEAHATLGSEPIGCRPDISFILKTRYSYVCCSHCSNKGVEPHLQDAAAAPDSQAGSGPSQAPAADAGQHAAAAAAAAAGGGSAPAAAAEGAVECTAAATAGQAPVPMVKQEPPECPSTAADGTQPQPDPTATGTTTPSAAADPAAPAAAALESDGATPGGAKETSPAAAAAAAQEAAGAGSGQGLLLAAAAEQGGSIRVGETVCPVHTHAVYRYSVSEVDDKMVKSFILQCPDCSHQSPELTDLTQLLQHVEEHLSTAPPNSHSKLSRARAAGRYSTPDTGSEGPNALRPIDDAVWQLLSRAAALTAVHITAITRAPAGVREYPRLWKPEATTQPQLLLPSQQQQQPHAAYNPQHLLQWRNWATVRLSGNAVLQRHANWARPSLERLDRTADPSRPAASLLDVIMAPPYIGTDVHYAGGALSKLVALIARKGKVLMPVKPGPKRRKSQQQQQQQQDTAAGQADTTVAAAAAAAAAAAGDGARPAVKAGQVLGMMLADDPLFEHLPELERIPAFLQQAQVGTLADVEFGLGSTSMISYNHMAACGICARTSKMLHHAGASAIRKCRYCCVSMCGSCCALLSSDSEAEEPSQQQEQQQQPSPQQQQQQQQQQQPEGAANSGQQSAGAAAVDPVPADAAHAAATTTTAAGRAAPTSTTAAAAAAAAVAAAAAAAGEGGVQGPLQKVKDDSAADEPQPWHDGLCPWCCGHPDTLHVTIHGRCGTYSNRSSAPKRRNADSADEAVASSSKRRRGSHGARAAPAAAAAAAAGKADSKQDDGGGGGGGAAAAAAAAAGDGDGAAAAVAAVLNGWPKHVGQLTAAELGAYAGKLSMTKAQVVTLGNYRRSGCRKELEWWLLDPATVRDLPQGYLAFRVARPDNGSARSPVRWDTSYVTPCGIILRSFPDLQRHAQMAQPAAAAAAAIGAAGDAANGAAAQAAAAQAAARDMQMGDDRSGGAVRQELADGMAAAAAAAADSDSLDAAPCEAGYTVSSRQATPSQQPREFTALGQPMLRSSDLQQQQQQTELQPVVGTAATAAAAAETTVPVTAAATGSLQARKRQRKAQDVAAAAAAAAAGGHVSHRHKQQPPQQMMGPSGHVPLSQQHMQPQQQQQQQLVVVKQEGQASAGTPASSAWVGNTEAAQACTAAAATAPAAAAVPAAGTVYAAASGAQVAATDINNTRQQQQQQQQPGVPLQSGQQLSLLAPFASWQQQQDAARMSDAGSCAFPRGFELPVVETLPDRTSRLALSKALLKVYSTLKASLGPPQQQQQVLQQLQAVSRGLLGAAADDEDWREELLLNYSFLQSWVALGDVEECGKALVTLLASSSEGLK